eukprot:scaffold8062_cov71-Cyclotella_meneghiniana.AAC.8
MGEGTGDDNNIALIRGFFMSIAVLFKHRTSNSTLELALALQSDEFCKWNVLQAAHHAGFGLNWYNKFDCSGFPGYKPSYACGTGRDIKNARFYVFQMKKENADELVSDFAREILLHRRFETFLN